jgi:DNA polymerase beta
MNSVIIEVFQKLINELLYNKPPNYSFKINSFNKIIKIINNLDYEITLINLYSIDGFSKKITDRIEEILNTGKLKEIKKTIDNIEEFNKLKTITGIGPAKAKKLLTDKITYDKLISNPKNYKTDLTHHQLIGLKYIDDLNKSIPRSVIEEVEQFLNTFDFICMICGSYRRGKSESGDIDILIQDNGIDLKFIIDLLTKKKFLIDHLTNNGKTKYMGICKIPTFSQYMRVDIRLINKSSFPFAILYFTGNKNNNTFMRNKAIKLGYKLNEYELTDSKKNKIKLTSEKDIYEFLELPYKSPQERNYK